MTKGSDTNYNSKSPYAETRKRNWYLDILNLRDIPPDDSDQDYEIPKKFHQRPELAANDLYNTTKLWWVFIVRNRSIISDPIFDFEAEKVIKIPSPDKIKRLI